MPRVGGARARSTRSRSIRSVLSARSTRYPRCSPPLRRKQIRDRPKRLPRRSTRRRPNPERIWTTATGNAASWSTLTARRAPSPRRRFSFPRPRFPRTGILLVGSRSTDAHWKRRRADGDDGDSDDGNDGGNDGDDGDRDAGDAEVGDDGAGKSRRTIYRSLDTRKTPRPSRGSSYLEASASDRRATSFPTRFSISFSTIFASFILHKLPSVRATTILFAILILRELSSPQSLLSSIFSYHEILSSTLSTSFPLRKLPPPQDCLPTNSPKAFSCQSFSFPALSSRRAVLSVLSSASFLISTVSLRGKNRCTPKTLLETLPSISSSTCKRAARGEIHRHTVRIDASIDACITIDHASRSNHG